MKKKKSTKSRKGIGGRPTVMTEQVIQKLEYCFSIGCSDRMACFQAGIALATFYDWQEKHPEFIQRKEALKDNMEFKALHALNNSLDQGDTKFAIEYLKRRKKEDWSERHEQTGKDGSDLIAPVIYYPGSK